jgi:hypothetical protein
VRSSAPRQTTAASCVAPPGSPSCLQTDPVHNTGLRIATGAFRTGRPDSLYVESDKPTFTVRMNLRCNYVMRLATQRASLTQSCVPPSLRHKHDSLTSAPSTCGCSASRSTATWHTVTPIYPPQTSTGSILGYPTPYLPSGTYQVRSSATSALTYRGIPRNYSHNTRTVQLCTTMGHFSIHR